MRYGIDGSWLALQDSHSLVILVASILNADTKEASYGGRVCALINSEFTGVVARTSLQGGYKITPQPSASWVQWCCSAAHYKLLPAHILKKKKPRAEQSRAEQQEEINMRAPAVALLLVVLVAASYQDLAVAAGGGGGGGGVAADDGVCDAKCQKRCSLKVAGRCMGLCKMCCGRCNGCVPSGPYASKDECPCYRDMTSPKSRRPKCP